MFESKDDSGQFLIVDIVVSFGVGERSRMEGDGVNAVFEFLRDDGAYSISGCISF